MARTPAPLRAIAVLLRALLGLALLAALVGGVPYLLLEVGHQPAEVSGGLDLLTQQDDGSLFLVALTCIGWVAWAAFTLSVLVEIAAVLRRRSAPRIKGLGGMQSLASFLIGGIVLLAPTAASAATTTPAVAAVHTVTVGESSTSAKPTARTDEETWPRHTVSSASELPWDLAEEYLGDGKRWKDIAALNPDVPQLASGDQYLPKGTVIKLPADARPVAPAAAATASPAPDKPAEPQQATTAQADPVNAEHDKPTTERTARPESITVRSGDSLWSIADKQGDPTDWPAIFEANKGEVTPDGGRFTNPNLIFPGQELNLPQTGAKSPTPPPTDTSHDDPQTPDHADDQTPAPEQTPDKEAEDEVTPAPSRTADPTSAPTTVAPAPSKQGTDREQPSVAPVSDDGDQALVPAGVWMGAGALAAALVGTLGTRRVLQQRRRRPGRRIPMPQGRAAATEQGLRAAQHPTGFDLLDTALRTLALNLAAVGRELPVLQAVVLHESKVELHLPEDTAPMKPFTAAAGRQDLWICTASSPDLATEETLKEADAPYPALVSIGWDGAGHLVLVDLEHVGVLNLAGDGDFGRHVLQAIAIELASTPLPGHIEVTALAHTAEGLEDAAPERVVRIDSISDAAADLTSHTADQRRALAAVGAGSLRAARLLEDAADAWTPHILLATALPDGAETSALLDTVAQEPRAAGAVITAGTSTDVPASTWTIDCQGPDHTVALPGSKLPIKLQGLSDEHFADAIELLTLAASDTDVPAPEWTHEEQDGQDSDPLEHYVLPTDGAADSSAADAQGDDEDGLPAEYIELEITAAENESQPEPPTADRSPNESKAGPSLADVLSAESDAAPGERQENGEAPATTTATAPTVGPADVALALVSPCPAPPVPAVHVTIPTPATAAPSEAPSPADAEQQVDVEAAADAGPAVLLLGPVAIKGASGRIDSSRRNAGTELVAFLALNPGVDHHAVDDALWPGRLVGKEMRNAVISRTRSWLGKDPNGKSYLPRVQDTGDSRYRLGESVTCDWTRFQRLARTGLTRHGEDGDLALRRALALVRGRPFTGIDPQRYAWAEPDIQEMVSAIVDVAYELSSRQREAGNIPSALWAARRGLLAAEESEMLHRQIFLAHHSAGDIDALRQAAARLVRINEQLLGGVDMEAETAELLRNLLPRKISRAR